MNRQNQEYFNSKRRHEENVSPKAWIKVIPILIVLLGVMAWATNKTGEIGEQRANEEMQNIGTRILESNKTETQTEVVLENLGLTIELHEGLRYDYSTQVNTLTAISQDSNELAYLIGEVPLNMQKSNMKELWINGVKEKDPNQIFTDTLGQTIVKTTQNGKHYKGILKFRQINGKTIVLNSVSIENKFDELEPKMKKVFESIKEE
jgi:hypothetical protein